MKRLYVAVILAAVILGCKREADRPPEAAEASHAESEQVYLGKPLGHWTQLVKQGQTDEELATAVDALILALEGNDVTVVVTAADAIETIGPKGRRHSYS